MPENSRLDDPVIKRFSEIFSRIKLPLAFRSEPGPSRPDDADRLVAGMPPELQKEIDPDTTVVECGLSSYNFPLLDGGYLLVRTRGNQIVFISAIFGNDRLTIAAPDATLP